MGISCLHQSAPRQEYDTAMAQGPLTLSNPSLNAQPLWGWRATFAQGRRDGRRTLTGRLDSGSSYGCASGWWQQATVKDGVNLSNKA